MLDTDDKAWDFSFDLNVKSMHRTIRAFLPGMLEKGARLDRQHRVGRRRSVRGIPNRYVYGATKAAVIGLTKAVAADFIKQRHPRQRDLPRHDPVALARPAHRRPGQGDGQDRRGGRARPSSTASRWAGSARAEEIAWLAVYLASDEASYTTGQIHLADGGFAL